MSAGSLTIGGDVEAERFEVDGSFRVSGPLNADEIAIELDGGRSTAQEIGGSKITVRRKRGHLEVQSVEGDEIYLEATEAQTIRGKRVKLGEGCPGRYGGVHGIPGGESKSEQCEAR